MKQIRIEAGSVAMTATLIESPTAAAVWEATPFEANANVWGDEVYFTAPVSVEQEAAARAEVEIGEIAYWPPGSAFCIFFGATPISSGEKPKAYSPVNVFGATDGDATAFGDVTDGMVVRVSRVE
ncbi:MAG: hypothetical protein HON70_40080 [Lentisphaerae bacterium]|nr:hypothetical protein [Lentisphaerota bacterium]